MLPPPLPPKSVTLNTCPKCGKKVDPTWQHCGYCGSELPAISETTPKAQTPPSINGPIRRPTPKRSPLVWITIGCGLIAIASITLLIVLLNKNGSDTAVPAETEELTAPQADEINQTPTPMLTQTATLHPTLTKTPAPTNTPQPTATSEPKGVSAIVPDPSEWPCQRGPSTTVYTTDGFLDSDTVMIISMNRDQTWFETISEPSGQSCWIPMMAFDRDSFVKTDIPIVDDPEPPSTVYYGYKYAECSTGWILYSTSYVQCLKMPTCYLRYPPQSSAQDNKADAISSCQSTGGNNIYCITTIPFTFDVIDPYTTSYPCNIPRIDHSSTDINYELFWLKIP